MCLIFQLMEYKDPLATTALPEIDLPGERAVTPSGGINVTIDQEAAKKFVILVVDDSADHVANAQFGSAVTLPNLILMDVSMPQLDGFGATRQIREQEALKNIPVIAVTAFGTQGFQRAAYDAGVSGYLTKPIDFDRMHRLVARLLAPGTSGNLSGNLTGNT